MENLPRKLEKELVKAAGKPRKFKKKEKWTLLLINDSGKTIQIKGIKILAKAGAFLILAILLSAGGIYSYTKFNGFESIKSFVSISNISDNQDKENNVPKETIANKTSVNQKDTALKNTDIKKKEEKLPDTGKETINTEENKIEPLTTEIVKKTVIEKDLAKPDTSNQIQQDSPVSIDDFECSYKKGRDYLDVKFNIKNNSSDSDSVSGHVVVVLKDKKNDHRKWIALPDDVKLVSGKPTGEDTGQTFSISFFKTLHFRAKGQTDPGRFKMASIYIFSREGDLLMEQDQEIIIDQNN